MSTLFAPAFFTRRSSVVSSIKMTRSTNIYETRLQIINRIVDHFENSRRFFFVENLIQVTKIKKKKEKLTNLSR